MQFLSVDQRTVNIEYQRFKVHYAALLPIFRDREPPSIERLLRHDVA
jgi:hypothetical protein